MVLKSRGSAETRTNGSSYISVAVRVRPIKLDEAGEQFAVSMHGATVTVSTNEQTRDFHLDQCYWSSNPMDSHYASQEDVFHGMGKPMLHTMLTGYHAAILFCGHHGAGKTSSLMGYGSESGLLVRILDQLFQESNKRRNTHDAFSISVSYFELYRERVVDMLQPSSSRARLAVCEHPTIGVVLPGLVVCPVESMAEVQNVIFEFGNRNRIAWETNLNPRSMNAHLFVSVHLRPVASNGVGLCARLDLIELGGFERMQGIGEPTKWCSDPSLHALRRMVDALGREQNERESNRILHNLSRNLQLTSLLRQPLSGSCRTSLLAAVAPTMSAVPWTLHTLEFANSVRQVQTAPRPCQLPIDVIAVLKDEIAVLTDWLKDSLYCDGQSDIHQEVEVRSNLIMDLERSEESKAAEASEQERRRKAKLLEWGQGDTRTSRPDRGLQPLLLNVSVDPLLTGVLKYCLSNNCTTAIGCSKSCAVCLQGIGIPDVLCEISNVDNRCLSMTVSPGCRVLRNGLEATPNEAIPLQHQDRLVFGFSRIFRVAVPLMWEEICQSACGRPNALKEQCLRASNMDYAACLREVQTHWPDLGPDLDTWNQYLKTHLPLGVGRAALALDAIREALPLMTEATTLVGKLCPDIGWKARVDISVEALLESGCGHVQDAIVVRVSQKDMETQRWIYSQFKEFLEKLRDKCSEVLVEKLQNSSSEAIVDPDDIWHTFMPVPASLSETSESIIRSFGDSEGAVHSICGTLVNEVALQVTMARAGGPSAGMIVRKRSGPPPAFIRPRGGPLPLTIDRGGPLQSRSGGNAGAASAIEAGQSKGGSVDEVIEEQTYGEPSVEDLQGQLRRLQAKRRALEYERDKALAEGRETCALMDETNRALDKGRRELYQRGVIVKGGPLPAPVAMQSSVTRMQSQPVIPTKQAGEMSSLTMTQPLYMTQTLAYPSQGPIQHGWVPVVSPRARAPSPREGPMQGPLPVRTVSPTGSAQPPCLRRAPWSFMQLPVVEQMKV